MSDKFRRGRSGTERFLKKHKQFGKRSGEHRQERREHRPSWYDIEASYYTDTEPRYN